MSARPAGVWVHSPVLMTVVALLWALVLPHPTEAEPTFLSKQYTRCTACHYSPTGGGLLTPYGRSLSREDISMMGRRAEDAPPPDASKPGEEAFLGGLLGRAVEPFQLGIDLRPSHLGFRSGELSLPDRNFFMNLDFLGAYQKNGWTLYGEVGRQPGRDDWSIDSYEHWVSYQDEGGLGVRVGRFLPAYGVRFADHTDVTREVLGLAQYDQVYGVELSVTGERSLVQLSVGPGRADSVDNADGRRALTASGRVQVDLSPRTVLVGSGLYRHESQLESRSMASGVAFGFAPLSRVTTWTQFDARFQDQSASDRTYAVTNRTSLEALPGIWLTVSPQLRWTDRDPQAEVRRLLVGTDVFPRTHWHVNLSYYRDRAPFFDLLVETFLAQLHLYL